MSRKTAAEYEVIDAGIIAAHKEGLILSAISARLGVGTRRAKDVLAKNGMLPHRAKPSAPLVKVTHGSYTMRRACDCAKCTKSRQAESKRAYQRSKELFDSEVHEHGLPATYARGCRCPRCERGQSRYVKSRNIATERLASNCFEPWTTSEDEAVLDTSRTMMQTALDLGRTYYAVAARRQKLRQDIAALASS